LVDMVAIGMWWAEKEENGLDLWRLKAGGASDEWDCCLRWWGTYADAKSSCHTFRCHSELVSCPAAPHLTDVNEF
jgi:hypothetical protein